MGGLIGLIAICVLVVIVVVAVLTGYRDPAHPDSDPVFTVSNQGQQEGQKSVAALPAGGLP